MRLLHQDVVLKNGTLQRGQRRNELKPLLAEAKANRGTCAQRRFAGGSARESPLLTQQPQAQPPGLTKLAQIVAHDQGPGCVR